MRSFARSARNMHMLGKRQLLNLSRIKTKYGDPVAIHFYTDGHTIQDLRDTRKRAIMIASYPLLVHIQL